MLQAVRNSELKWGSYSLWKMTAPSWRKDSAKCCGISLLLREFRNLFVQCCGFPPEVARYMPQAGSWEPQGGSQLRSPARIACCCEVISQPSWASAKSRRHHFLLRNGSWSIPIFATNTFGYLFFRYFYINFHFLLVFSHSCNSLARKYPRKGKLPSYINSLVNTKKEDSERDVCNIDRYIIYRINEQSTCSVFHIYSSFIFIFLLANQTLRIFPQRMRG